MSIAARSTLLITVALAACAERPAGDTTDADCCSVAVRITVPRDAGDVYLTGNQETLGPWQPDRLLMASDGLERSAQIEVQAGTEFEYKFTLGSWDRQALGPSGTVLPNYNVVVDGSLEVSHEISAFKADPVTYIDDWEGSGVQGTLVYWKDVASNHLARPRHVSVRLV